MPATSIRSTGADARTTTGSTGSTPWSSDAIAPAGRKRQRHADRGADQRRASIASRTTSHSTLPRVGAERHAHAELGHAPGDAVRDRAVEAEAGEQQRDDAERARQACDQPVVGQARG